VTLAIYLGLRETLLIGGGMYLAAWVAAFPRRPAPAEVSHPALAA